MAAKLADVRAALMAVCWAVLKVGKRVAWTVCFAVVRKVVREAACWVVRKADSSVE